LWQRLATPVRCRMRWLRAHEQVPRRIMATLRLPGIGKFTQSSEAEDVTAEDVHARLVRSTCGSDRPPGRSVEGRSSNGDVEPLGPRCGKAVVSTTPPRRPLNGRMSA